MTIPAKQTGGAGGPGIPNVHLVDELGALKEEIKNLQTRADEIRDILLDDPEADLDGKVYVAQITSQTRRNVDLKALEEALGAEVIAPFVKATTYKVLKTKEK